MSAEDSSHIHPQVGQLCFCDHTCAQQATLRLPQQVATRALCGGFATAGGPVNT